MKKIPTSIILVLVLFLGGYFWWFWQVSPLCIKNCQTKIFVIEKGEALSQIARRLEQEGLIRSSAVFQILVARKGIAGKIQAGDFRLNPRMKPLEIAQELTHGTLDYWVTIIEGLRREEIAEKLFQSGLVSFSQEEFLEETKNFEGKLFPDTYLFPKDITSKKIVEIMSKNFAKKTPFLTKENLILASIVEREARNKDDRPIVAGILSKRVENNWAMQADATVQYAVASVKCKGQNAQPKVDPPLVEKCEWWPKNLTPQDLEIRSPYNTYQNRGFPPAPISNPGLAAINAAINPVKTDYWFYLSDKEGKIHYAKTMEEHQENIQKYLK